MKVLNAIAVVLTLLVAGCLSGPSRGTRLILHVDGPVARASRGQCVFILQAAVREGGDQRTCLTSIEGFPAPRATMHSKGLMTFALPRGAVVVRVRVTQRFADDGAHAQQKVEGVIVRGRGEFTGAHGSLRGGGAIVDSNEGLRVIRLAYQLTVVGH